MLIDMFDKAIDNEKELLASIAGGDQYAFTILFKHYQRFVYFSGRKLTHSEELATEIVQDIFLKICDHHCRKYSMGIFQSKRHYYVLI